MQQVLATGYWTCRKLTWAQSVTGQIIAMKRHCWRLNTDVFSGTGLGNKISVAQEITTLLSSFNPLCLQISMSGRCLSWNISPCRDILCFFIYHHLLGEVWYANVVVATRLYFY